MPENKPAYPHPEAKPVGGKRYFDKKPEKKFGEKKFGDRKFGEKKFGDRDKRFGDKKPERRFDRKDSGEKRFPHPEAKPVSGAPAPQKAFPHPEAKPVAASEDRPRFARPTVRPAGPAPHEHNRKPAPAKRPVERQENPRQTALNILQDVSRGGAYASLALGERLRNSKLAQRDRDFVSALVYGVLEKRITLDWLIDGKLTREGDLESLVRDMLRLGLYQILYMTRVPDSAAVDETVKLAHAMRREAQAGFINAILRGFAREKESIVWPDRESEPVKFLSIRYSMPEWIVDRLIAEYGFGEAEDIVSYEPQARPIAVRRCADKTSPREFEAMMTEKGWSWQPSRLPDVYLVTDGIGDVGIEKEYLRGLYTVQGESSVLAAMCVAPKAGQTVLDACAAPGGKTACLSEMMHGTGRVYAWDKHEHRVELIRSMVKRLRLDNVRPAVRDATVIKQDLMGTMDAVLVDAPCSGLGVMLSKPDVKYRQTPESIAELVGEQERILNACCRYVKPGGTLVYSTCTLLREENADQVENFLKKHPEFEPDPEGFAAALPAFLKERAQGWMLQLQAHRDGMDGFFIARMRRKPE